MQATITYLLTEQAQRAQMAATGQPVARKQTIVAEVNAEDIDLMAVTEDGAPYLDLTAPLAVLTGANLLAARAIKDWWDNYTLGTTAEVPDIAANVLDLVRAGLAKHAADAAQAKALADARWAERVAGHAALLARLQSELDADPAATPREPQIYVDHESGLPPDIDALHSAIYREIQRRREANRARKSAEDAATEQAKNEYIGAWIATNGDEMLRQQATDTLLCRKTVLSMIAGAAFAAAGVPERVIVPETCSSRECPCEDTGIDCLPRSIYPVWRKIKATLPEGSSATFSRVRDCQRDEDWDGEGESAGPAYYTAEITMPHGPFQFERRVKLEA